MDNPIFLIFQLAILLMSIVIHEFSHGWMAYQLGDTTAKDYGRLTLNPIKHLDLWGSFIVPLTIYVLSYGRAVFGWAKPVPYNPYNLRDRRYGSAKVAIAGPGSNLLVALVFGLMVRVMPTNSVILANLAQLFSFIVLINIVLAVFNLVPIPPLDGSKILFTFLPRSANSIRVFLEQYGMIILLLFIFFAFDLILPIVLGLFKLIVGRGIML